MRRKLFQYSDTQRTARFVFKDGSKKVLPQHLDGSEWITKAGPNEWPAYREEKVTGQKEIYEFEGEKCAEIAASDGLAAISQPGFAHNVQQIAQRYRRLKAAGAELIVVVADNDETGPKRAAQSDEAARNVGLDCLVLNAQDIWDNMPKGGSIDDAPGEGAERIAPLLAQAAERPIGGPVEVMPDDDRSGIPSEPEKRENPAFYVERSRLLLEALGPYWRADEENDNAWRQWTGKCWKQVNSNDPIKRELVRTYNKWDWLYRDGTTRRNDLELFRAEVGPEMGTPRDELIPFANCCLEWTTGVMHPHDPQNWNNYVLPFDYDPDAAPPETILWFLKDRLEHEEVIAMYRAFVWHVLTGKDMKCFLELTGGGDTGKSVLTRLVVAAIGRQNMRSVTVARLEHPNLRFETFKFRGKRLLVANESQGYSGPMEVTKAITGGDVIPAERKNSTEDVDYTYTGGFMFVGNSPLRPSDVSNATINRRRSIRMTKAVAVEDQRDLLRFNKKTGQPAGEFVPELGAFIKWVLAMDSAEARRAISRDVTSLARAETEREVLLTTDRLAEWANDCLIFDDRLSGDGEAAIRTNVGTLPSSEGPGSDSTIYLLPNYRQWLREREDKGAAFGQNNFKEKLVSLLRETLKLPLPPGDIRRGAYKPRNIGSVVPYIRLRRRNHDDGVTGVVDFAFGRMVPVTTRNDLRHDQTPVGNGRNGCNDQTQTEPIGGVNKPANEPVSGCMGEKRSDGRYDRYAHYLEGFQGELAITQPLQPDDEYQLGSGYDVEAG
jgi:phage/plasmid-associated DNA primase